MSEDNPWGKTPEEIARTNRWYRIALSMGQQDDFIELLKAERRVGLAAWREAMSVFHMGNGWDFERVENGAVRISTLEGNTVTIPAIEWASVLTAVSPGAGDGQVFADAKKLHGID